MTSRRRTLYLLRHAKSSWSDEQLADRDRPLAPRGEDAVMRLRRYVGDAEISPELVLCSSARRTVMTLDGIAPAFPAGTTVLVEDGLYGAPSERLLGRVSEVDDGVTSVMLIGHNPGLEVLATLLVGGGDEALRRRLETKFPTGALAELAVATRWRDLTPADATLESFVVPRDL
jgi:phosphohistidine phosphatase